MSNFSGTNTVVDFEGNRARFRTIDACEGQCVIRRATNQFEMHLSVDRGMPLPSEVDLTMFENLPDQRKPLAALVPGSLDDIRFEIGAAIIKDGIASLISFGTVPFSFTRIIF